MLGQFHSLQAQQPFTYTGYMENLTPLNPAYSLLHPTGGFDLAARKQWVGVEGAPSTLLADAWLPLGSDRKTTAGLVLLHDDVAVEHPTAVDAVLANTVQISAVDYIGVSINAGFRRYVTEFASLDPDDMALNEDIRENVVNAGFGVMVYGKNEDDEIKYYAGLSVPRVSLRTLGGGSVNGKRHLKDQFYIAGGFYKNLTDDIKIKPAVLISHSSNLPLQADFSTMVYLKDKLGLGFNYRSNNEAAGVFSVMVKENFRIGYSYQLGFGAGRIGNFGNDTHEIGLSLKINDY